MLEIRDDLTQEAITSFFLDDPKLCLQALADSDLSVLYYEKRYPLSPNSIYVGAYSDNKLVAIVKMEQFTTLAACVHPYVKTSLQGSGFSDEMVAKLAGYIRTKYSLNRAIATVPAPCKHVIAAITRFGMKHEGTIKDIVMWRQKVTDLHFYSLNLKEEEA